MDYEFQPMGIPASSSFAVSSEVTLRSTNLPVTASMAEYTKSPPGPQGKEFVIGHAYIISVSGS